LPGSLGCFSERVVGLYFKAVDVGSQLGHHFPDIVGFPVVARMLLEAIFNPVSCGYESGFVKLGLPDLDLDR
jgi:hypothetical protein